MHAGAFEPRADGHLAARFDDTGGSAQTLLVELGIAHPAAIGFEVVETLPGLRARRDLSGDGPQQSIESSVVEFRVPAFGPLGGAGIGGTVHGLAEVAEVLFGVEAVDDLDRAGEQFVGDVPDPGRVIPQDRSALRAAEADAVSDFRSPGELVSHARQTWLRARRAREQLAEWIETLRLLPIPLRA